MGTRARLLNALQPDSELLPGSLARCQPGPLARVASPEPVALGPCRLDALRRDGVRAHRHADRADARGSPAPRQIAAVANGFQAGIGLLLLSVSAATALAEERVRGNLDVLLSTPLSTRSIVWGKWCGAFRAVPIVAICPGVLASALALDRGRWEAALLVVGLFLAYGAAVTSLGLALATWIRRLDFAVALNVGVLGIVTVGWFLGVMAGPAKPTLAAGSPIMGITFPTVAMWIFGDDQWSEVRIAWILWIAIYVLISAALALLTLATFNRCLGRMPESVRPIRASPIMIDDAEQRGELPGARGTGPGVLKPANEATS